VLQYWHYLTCMVIQELLLVACQTRAGPSQMAGGATRVYIPSDFIYYLAIRLYSSKAEGL